MYEIPLVIDRRYRRGVRRALIELPVGFSEVRGFRKSWFTVRTPCKEMCDILLDIVLEDRERQAS